MIKKYIFALLFISSHITWSMETNDNPKLDMKYLILNAIIPLGSLHNTILNYLGPEPIPHDIHFEMVSSVPALQKEILYYLGHADWLIKKQIKTGAYITALTYLPSCKHLMIGSADGSIAIFDTESADQALYTLDKGQKGKNQQIGSLVYLDDEIISLSAAHMLKRWDLSQPDTIACTEQVRFPGKHLVYCPQTRQLAASIGQIHTIALENNPIDGSAPTTTNLPGHATYIQSLAYSPDGKYLASNTFADIKIWDIAQQKELYTFTPGNIEKAIKWISPIELLVGMGNGEINLWDFSNPHKPELIKTLTGHTGAITAINFELGNSFFVSTSYDKTIKIWDIQSGICMNTLTVPGENNVHNHCFELQLALSQNGQYIATADYDTITIYENKKAILLAVQKTREDARKSPHNK
jgi:WD40 repeat protein